MSKRPFSCGAQAADWLARNCDMCKKIGRCDIERAVMAAYFGEGTVADEIYIRMGGHDNEDMYTWVCPERQVIE